MGIVEGALFFLTSQDFGWVPCGDAQSQVSPFLGLRIQFFGSLGSWNLRADREHVSGDRDMCTPALSCIDQGFCESPLYMFFSSPDQSPEGKPAIAWGPVDNLLSSSEVPILCPVFFPPLLGNVNGVDVLSSSVPCGCGNLWTRLTLELHFCSLGHCSLGRKLEAGSQNCFAFHMSS